MGDESGVRGLRAKYLDWCSARVAERFLDLSPEEIYELARPAEGADASSAGRSASGGVAVSYEVLVQRATEALLGRMSLPEFEEWARAYAADPARYEAEMLGFWREASGGGA